MRFERLNNLTGWAIWALATLVFVLTVEPTASFWDCGEFIASAYKLEVGHPPGAPFFMLLARFLMVPMGPETAALAANGLSVLPKQQNSPDFGHFIFRFRFFFKIC